MNTGKKESGSILDIRTMHTLKIRYEKLIIGILGRINSVENAANGLGYTTPDGDIYLGFNHELLCGLDESHHISALDGVFAHEVMHQILTDFQGEQIYMAEHIPERERGVFHQICNVMEDSYIEYFASGFLGNRLVHALEYMRAYAYCQSPKLDGESGPFSEFFQAAIHYGDGGLVKGEFTHDSAKECFKKAIPLMDQHLRERDSQTRFTLVNEVFEITRPLWEPELAAQEFMKKIAKMLKNSGHEDASSHGTPSDASLEENASDEPSSEGSKESRKAKMREKIGAESAVDKSAEGKDPCPEADHADEAEQVKPSGDSKQGASAGDKGSEANPAEGTPNGVFSENHEQGGSKDDAAGEEDDQSYLDSKELSEEDLIERARELAEIEKDIQAESRSSDLNLSLESGGYKNLCKDKRCFNIDVPVPGESVAQAYQSLAMSMRGRIEHTAAAIERIFRKEQSEKLYRNSGSISIDRLARGHMSARVFTRRRDPKNLRNIHIMVAVDESGSMHQYNKIQAAQKATIALAEVFAKLNVRLSVLGFTADVNGHDVVHRIYLRGDNTVSDRTKLLGITARSDNFDGYTIRYCGQYLKRAKEEYKILIVISDGEPACYSYDSLEEGIQDVSMAVKEVSKYAKVMGILLGNTDPEKHRAMYGYNFLHIKSTNDLFDGIAELIRRALKDW